MNSIRIFSPSFYQPLFSVHCVPGFCKSVHLFAFCLIFMVPKHRNLPIWDKGTKDYKNKAEGRPHINPQKR